MQGPGGRAAAPPGDTVPGMANFEELDLLDAPPTVLVVDDELPSNRGRFTIVAPLYQDGSPPGIRFGLEDESSRLNLNMLIEADKVLPGSGRTLLMGLPGMTEEIADAILDYMDEDDEVREFGAEINEYTGLDPPYEPKNGPLAMSL